MSSEYQNLTEEQINEVRSLVQDELTNDTKKVADKIPFTRREILKGVGLLGLGAASAGLGTYGAVGRAAAQTNGGSGTIGTESDPLDAIYVDELYNNEYYEDSNFDSISTDKLNSIIDASRHADSGSGTESDPWINAVSNAFRELPDDGGMIWLRPGRYEQNETYTIEKWHQLFGAGAGGTQIDRASGLDDPMFIFDLPTGVRGYTFPRWQGFIVDGQSDRSGSPSYLVRTALDGWLRDFRMQQVWIEDGPQSGILLEGHNISVAHCAIEHCKGDYGLVLQGADDAIVRDSRLLGNDNGQATVSDNSRRGIKFEANLIGGGTTGLELRSSSKFVHVTGNTFFDSNTGLQLGGDDQQIWANSFGGHDAAISYPSGLERIILNGWGYSDGDPSTTNEWDTAADRYEGCMVRDRTNDISYVAIRGEWKTV